MPPNLLIYLMRRDLRIADNPILHTLSSQKSHGFTHLLPLYVFSAQQLEVSGFISADDKDAKSPFPEARSQVGGFWRCGPHRAKFLAETVWDLKCRLEDVGSGLCIRVGIVDEIIRQILSQVNGGEEMKVGGVWMTAEEGVEEKREEEDVEKACQEAGVEFKIWRDEKYFIDDRDLPFSDPEDLPGIFTTYRKLVEPLRNAPRQVLATPAKESLQPFPVSTLIPSEQFPFTIPTTYQGLQSALLRPLTKLCQPLIKDPPLYPKDTDSAHPFKGGESCAEERLNHLISSGAMNTYNATRNGLLGVDFSTKLSGWLALGSITARQIHAALISFEEGTEDGKWKGVEGYGKGANDGTTAVRFELLWRDYMRLCTRKFGRKLFHLNGFRQESTQGKWSSPDRPLEGQSKEEVAEMLERFLNGTTGMGLIDASQRELFHTGYTSNRARQNAASFLAKHLHLDWRLGAEWYECMLVDYDVSSNWGNWQYVAGVGNDPRGEARVFNPVKQAFDYDPQGEYVVAWVQELRGVTDPGEIFQAWTIKEENKKELGLGNLAMVDRPLKKIEFTVGRRAVPSRRWRRGGPRSGRGDEGTQMEGGRGSGMSNGQTRGGGYGGRGYGSSRGHIMGRGARGRGRGRGGRGEGDVDRQVTTGFVEEVKAA